MPMTYDPAKVRGLTNGLANQIPSVPSATDKEVRTVEPPYTPRQQGLTGLWDKYRCETYKNHRVGWDGAAAPSKGVYADINAKSWTAPGFTDRGGETVALQYRRPTAPYYLAYLIVHRFTELLFSQKKHPTIGVTGDADTQDFLDTLLRVGHFWSVMTQARNYGGGMGSACVSFSFVAGRVVFTAHDPRWCEVKYKDSYSGDLAELCIRYAYQENGEWYWYRRVLNSLTDITWCNVPCKPNEDPKWDALVPMSTAIHGYGFVPARFVQNLPVPAVLDGDADCHGAYEMMEELDRLVAQANRGVLNNSDPTLLVMTDGELDSVTKGSDNALKLLRGDGAQYLELNGSGPESAYKGADRLEIRIMRHTQCVLDQHNHAVSKTATEIDQSSASMWRKADVLREQYGEWLIVPLLTDLLRACAVIIDAPTQPTVEGEVGPTRAVVLPMRAVKDPTTDKVSYYTPRVLGESRDLAAQWFEYAEPTMGDIQGAVKAATNAHVAGFIDQETGAKFVAKYFGVENVNAMLLKIKAEEEASRDDLRALTANAERRGLAKHPDPNGADDPELTLDEEGGDELPANKGAPKEGAV